MKPVELYCKFKGHRFVPYKDTGFITFKGIKSISGRCVRCHESLWMIVEDSNE